MTPTGRWLALSIAALLVAATQERVQSQSAASGPALASRPTARVPKAATAPAIDGKLDDLAWRQAVRLTFDRTIEKAVPTSQATEVLLLWDEQALYIGIRCHEPAVARIVPGQKGKDVPVWKADSVEVFFGQLDRYYCFGINAAGGTVDSLGNDMRWSTDFAAVAAIHKDGWTAEFALPLAKLADRPWPSEWIANFTRLRLAGPSPEETAWVPTFSKTSHLPDKLGKLILIESNPTK